MSGIKVECMMIKSLPVKQRRSDIMNYLPVFSAESFLDLNQLMK